MNSFVKNHVIPAIGLVLIAVVSWGTSFAGGCTHGTRIEHTARVAEVATLNAAHATAIAKAEREAAENKLAEERAAAEAAAKVAAEKARKEREAIEAKARQERAAAEAGFTGYTPDACLINRYEPGAKLGLHQDKDEEDAWAPIVSVSLGLPAVFLWGGKKRTDPVRRMRLESGDVAVWGGPARFVYHGVAPLKAGEHPLTAAARINLTFRKVFRK
jgi:alkylated DNA repair dioxygenase AlkB